MLALVRTVIVRAPGILRKSAIFVTNSGALAIGTIAMSGLGFVYWWLAARTFPPEVIGNASALLSMIGLVALLGEAGLGTLLIGEIVRYPGRESGLAAAAACVGGAIALGVALSFVFGEALFIPAGPIDGWLEAGLFVLTCSLTALSIVLDQALVGNLRSSGRMVRQLLFSAFKLMLVAGAAYVDFASSTAIILTWVTGLLASWIALDLLTRGGARRLVAPPDFQLLYKLRRKVFDHYALDVASQASGLIMPYLVLVFLSPAINAAFMAIWMLVSVAAMIPAAMATVLFPVVRANSTQSRHDIIVSLTASLLFALTCANLVYLYSQQMLGLFNPAYPTIAGSSLCFLGFSLVGSTLKFHTCALARLDDRMRRASFWFALGGALELCLAVAGAKLDGLQGLVFGWTLAVSIEGACAAFVIATATRRADSAAGRVGQEPAPLL